MTQNGFPTLPPPEDGSILGAVCVPSHLIMFDFPARTVHLVSKIYSRNKPSPSHKTHSKVKDLLIGESLKLTNFELFLLKRRMFSKQRLLPDVVDCMTFAQTQKADEMKYSGF